jgi:hypothetical protein
VKKKANLILILFLYTIIGLTDLAKADVLFHWNFDGILGEDMTLVTDKTSMVDLKKFKKPGIIADVTYGRPNPWMNTFGTSAEFFNDFTGPSRGAALAAMDIDSVLNLSGLDSFTIEFFLYPFAIKDCTLLGKGSGSKGYRIDMTTQGSLRFWINGDHNTIQTDPNTISRNRWYHIAVTYERHHISDPMSIFVNGSLRQSGGSSSAIQNTTTFFCVGRWTNQDPFTSFSYDQRDSYFSGRIDELRVSNEVLSPPEFLYHAARNKASYPYPENCAEQFSRTTDLRWQPAQDIERQWIYFGTDSNQLQLICEVGPDVNTISNATLGIALEAGQTYYWRIDHEETGDTWNFTTQDGLVKGNLKWLLHLGQTYDHVISNPWNITVDEISQSNGSAFAPAPGQIYNLSDSPMQGNTTNTTMIWTPMYNADGIFPCDNRFPNLHFYHVYVISPYNQVAQLCILSFGELAVWQNGQQVMPYQNSSSEAYPCQEISL